MSRNHRKVCTTLNYIEHFLILVPAIAGCISISAFASLLSSVKGLKNCALAAGIKKFKSIFKKKKKKHNKIVLLAKTKLNRIEVLNF